MATQILTKESFLKLLDKSINPDEFIVLSPDLSGSLIQKDKLKEKQISFAFSSDAFSKPGIGDFAFGKIIPISFCLCKKESLSEIALSKLT